MFDLFGVIRVRSPELMLEALKFMTISGIPEGRRIAAFTCSGGEALMVADDLIHKTELNVVVLQIGPGGGGAYSIANKRAMDC